MSTAAPRVCRSGPLDGLEVPRHRVQGAWGWFDVAGRAHTAPAPGRWLYHVQGDRLEFGGHGARRCGRCGATIDPDRDGRRVDVCPLCKTLHESDSRAILRGVPDRKEPVMRAPERTLDPPDAPEACAFCREPLEPANSPWDVSADLRGFVCSAMCLLRDSLRHYDTTAPEDRARRVRAVREAVLEGADVEVVELRVITDPDAIPVGEAIIAGPIAEASRYAISLETDAGNAVIEWARVCDATVPE